MLTILRLPALLGLIGSSKRRQRGRPGGGELFFKHDDLVTITEAGGKRAGCHGRIDRIGVCEQTFEPMFLVSIFADGEFMTLPYFKGQIVRRVVSKIDYEAHRLAELEIAA